MKTEFVIVREGMGGFVNPPGHAEHSYSVREFNVHGSRREYSSMSLAYAAGDETPWVPEHIKERCRRLLQKHPGEYIEEWERTVYSYFKTCYQDVERLEYGKPGTLIYPVPYYKLKPLLKQEGGETPKYTREYLDAENGPRRKWNEEEIERAKRIAVPENHLAYVFIRKFFPEAKPRLDLIENPPDDYGKKGGECGPNGGRLRK